MTSNKWIEFMKEYKKKHPNMKYGDLLIRASKSPEWIRYKKKTIRTDNDENTNNDTILNDIRNDIKQIKEQLSKLENFIKQ